MSTEWILKRKSGGTGHAVEFGGDLFAALCGRELDGSFYTEDTFAPSSNPAGLKLCRKCNEAVGGLTYGAAEWAEYTAA